MIGRDRLPAHHVRGSEEEELHGQVVEPRRAGREVAIGLPVERAAEVSGEPIVVHVGDVAMIARLLAAHGPRHVREQPRQAGAVRPERELEEEVARVQIRLDVRQVCLQERHVAPPDLADHFGRDVGHGRARQNAKEVVRGHRRKEERQLLRAIEGAIELRSGQRERRQHLRNVARGGAPSTPAAAA